MNAPQTYFEIASTRLDEQLRRIDGLDSKAASTLTFSAALLPVFGVVFAVSRHPTPTSATALYVAALAVYVVLLATVTAAYTVSRWSYRPDLGTLQQNSEGYPEDVMREWAADECLASVTFNEPRIACKGRFVRAAIGLLALDALLLSVAALVTIS